MKKNLENADTITKLILAASVIAFYFIGVISGPFARMLMMLAIFVLVIFAVRAFLLFITRD